MVCNSVTFCTQPRKLFILGNESHFVNYLSMHKTPGRNKETISFNVSPSGKQSFTWCSLELPTRLKSTSIFVFYIIPSEADLCILRYTFTIYKLLIMTLTDQNVTSSQGNITHFLFLLHEIKHVLHVNKRLLNHSDKAADTKPMAYHNCCTFTKCSH